MNHPDTNEIVYNPYEYSGRCFCDDGTKKQDTIEGLRNEIAYLRGMIKAYEKFLKDKGYIKEDEWTKRRFKRLAKKSLEMDFGEEKK